MGRLLWEKVLLIKKKKEWSRKSCGVKTKTRRKNGSDSKEKGESSPRSSIQRPWCHVKLHTPFQHPRHCTIVWGSRSTQSVPCNRTDILMHTTSNFSLSWSNSTISIIKYRLWISFMNFDSNFALGSMNRICCWIFLIN